MVSLIEKIKSLGEINTLSKHEQLVHGIIEAIDSEILLVGDQLPSINKMVGEIGFARKTIVKAYEELKLRGLVESKKIKGYFIISKETNVKLKVALLLFSFQRFQEEFYNSFRKELGKQYQIDVFFHHNNPDVFKTIFTNIQGKYGKYVVAPIPDEDIKKQLLITDPRKLLIIDRYLPMPKEYSYISQEFEENTFLKLESLLSEIKKYDKFILFFSDDRDYPVGIKNAFKRFVDRYGIANEIRTTYEMGMVRKGDVCFFISDTNLWDVLLDCRDMNYKLGSDVGILSHNDHVVKKIVSGGVTTISTDFIAMAKKAAYQIKNGVLTQDIVPFDLIKRNSL